MSAISTHFEMLLPREEQERISATPDQPEDLRVMRVLDHYVDISNERVKFKLALECIARINQNRPAVHVANECIAEAVKALR